MGKFAEAALQTIPARGNAQLNDTSARCGRCRSAQLTDTGVIRLLGAANQPYARYRISVGANIAIPEGGTVEPISIALLVDGIVLPSSVAIVTPAAVGDFWHVSITDYIDVPCRSSALIAIHNNNDQPIEMQNASLIPFREV